MNWGELGEEGTQFLLISPGLGLLGRGEHIFIWTEQPLYVIICGAFSVICVW